MAIMMKFFILVALSGVALSTCCPSGSTLTFVSDPTTFVTAPALTASSIILGTSVPATVIPSANINSAWSGTLPGAYWIVDAGFLSDNAVADTYRTYTRIFTLPCAPNGPGSATISILTDNSFVSSINGVSSTSCNNPIEQPFRVPTVCDITSMLKAGPNVLEITVHNWAQNGGSWGSNPTGLMYSLVVGV